jgi:DNA repair protein RecN (Recombination protein N)
MIEVLRISSLAVFDDVEIEFGNGLNTITGETGAGKSLIIKALTLLLGAKASGDLVRTGRDKAYVEALFSDGDTGSEIVLKRELSISGRSRCYINGELATAEKLSQMASGLVHIYGQHEYQDLLSPREQMRILEDICSISRADVTDAYDEASQALSELKRVENLISRSRLEQQSLEFTVQEIEMADIHEGMEKELKEQLDIALSAQELKSSCEQITGILYSDARSAIDILSEATAAVMKMSVHDKRLASFAEGLNSSSAQIEDIALSLRRMSEEYEYDENMIERLETRLHVLRDLKRKYSADEAGLINIMRDARQKLSLIEDSAHAIDDARRIFTEGKDKYFTVARFFLSKREKAAEDFSLSINKDLEDLGMPGTVFKVVQLDEDGLDKVFESDDMPSLYAGRILEGEFMVSTNVGLNMIPLARAASGGELSRIMLAIKARQRAGLGGSMIFDEIDSGIGGQAAIMIAEKLKKLAVTSQAIVVTHLHQVASAADSHLVVSKKIENNETFSSVLSVSGEGRVAELARMMGGESPGEALIKHARKLVKKG